jgi:hypothetical protein
MTLLLVLSMLVGCAQGQRGLLEAGSVDEAQSLIESYLAQASAGNGDRGWSLLHPRTQESHWGGDPAAYEAEADSQDWARFRWSVTHVVREEPGSYEVGINVAGGEPPVLVSKLATWMQGPESPGPTFLVRFDMAGGTGIYEATR